jgi:hypothetical protein
MPMVNMMKKRVQPRLLDHHAVLGQELGDDGRRDAGLGELARHVQPRRDDGALDRVEQVEARPARRSRATCRRPEHPVGAAADALGGQLVRPPDLEPPVLAELLLDLAHRAAEVQRLRHALLHQRRAAGGSIIAAATSQLAMIAYCGLVLVCIR